MNNEEIGLAAEFAIAQVYGLDIPCDYARRANQTISNFLVQSGAIETIFEREGIPRPIRWVAQDRNPIDFVLQDNKTLSVKTNQGLMGKVAPQIIGQPTQETYFEYLESRNILPGFSIENKLAEQNLPDNYANRAKIFKEITIANIDILVKEYWKNLFECDYLLHFYNLLEMQNPLENYEVYLKAVSEKLWRREDFEFTRGLQQWRESSTLKYCGVTIGEFQVHQNRNCFKFRFAMQGIRTLLNEGMI